MNKRDPAEILYHVSETMKAQTASIQRIQKDLHKMQIDIEVMKQTGSMPVSRKSRIKDAAGGGATGSIIMAFFVAIYEYFKAN